MLNSPVGQTEIPQLPARSISGIRIGFDAKRAFYNSRGLGKYSRNLIDSLIKIIPDNSFYLFTPKTKGRIILSPESENKINIISPEKLCHRAVGSLWRSKFMVEDIRNLKLDIYHGLSHELPFSIRETGAKAVVTVHDLIFIRFPKLYNPVNVFIYKKKLEYACKVADKIVAISSQTSSDLIRFLKINPEKIDIIPQGCNQVFRQIVSDEDFKKIRFKYSLPDKYLLYVGAIEERKNLAGILKAIADNEIEIPLVAIGEKTEYFHKIIKPFLAERKMKDILFPEGVRNDELPAFYQKALCFIYPSFYEGFGIPILEALTSGTPVITSKGSCFEETGGPGSLYIDPYKPDEIGEAIIKISHNMAFRTSLVEQGIEHSKLFSPDLIAKRYISLYNSILA
jgi:glycosyltransferase involved in cell wall biosynthesis